jgi:uncharacterized membrane protein
MADATIRIISIYLVGIAGIWKAIPVGIALRAHPLETASFTALGSITTVYLLFYFGERVKTWVIKKWSQEKLNSKKGQLTNIMDKYGTAGLGIICPGLFGPITTIIVGLLIVHPTSRLMPFLVVGIVIWSFALTFVAVLGVDFFINLFSM